MTCHNHQGRHLACHKFGTRQRGVTVGAGMQQCSQVAAEAHAHDGHRVVLLLGQQTAVEGHGIGAVSKLAYRMGIEGSAVGGLHVGHDIGEVGHSLVARKLPQGTSHGDAGAAIPGVHRLHKAAGPQALLVEHHGQDACLAHVGILVQHVQRPCVIYVITHVGLEDNVPACLHSRCQTEEKQKKGLSHCSYRSFL